MGGGIHGAFRNGFHILIPLAAAGRLDGPIIRAQVQPDASHGARGMGAAIAGRIHHRYAGKGRDDPAVGCGHAAVLTGSEA